MVKVSLCLPTGQPRQISTVDCKCLKRLEWRRRLSPPYAIIHECFIEIFFPSLAPSWCNFSSEREMFWRYCNVLSSVEWMWVAKKHQAKTQFFNQSPESAGWMSWMSWDELQNEVTRVSSLSGNNLWYLSSPFFFRLQLNFNFHLCQFGAHKRRLRAALSLSPTVIYRFENGFCKIFIIITDWICLQQKKNVYENWSEWRVSSHRIHAWNICFDVLKIVTNRDFRSNQNWISSHHTSLLRWSSRRFCPIYIK